MIEQTGGCLCGDVRFRLTGAPYEVDYCHCHSCRKHTGASVSVFADCNADLAKRAIPCPSKAPGDVPERA